MVANGLGSLFLLLASSSLLSVSAATLKFIPNAYIVEFDTEHAKVPEAKLQGKLESYLTNLHDDFHSHLRRRGVDYTVRQEFHEPSIFSGVSVHLNNATLLSELHAAPNVKSVYRTRAVSNPNNNLSVKAVKSTKAAQANTFSPHVMTGVNTLHAQGYYGKGVKVAILDTGVDYKHPALGGCFGPKCLVSFGYDLVGDNYNGGNTPVPDSDPYSNCATHGTHVTGIVAANDTKLGFTGVAPQASIGMYRVFGCTGGSGDDVLMNGLLRAYQDGANVISMSIGMPSGWSESPLSAVAGGIVSKGVVVIASQGNEASSGMFFSSAPASGVGVISVASVDNAKFTAFTAKSSINRDIQYFAPVSFGLGPLPLGYYGEGCNAYPAGTNLRNQVVFVRRGTCTITSKAQNAAKFGATVLIVANSDLAPVVPESSAYGVKSALISKADGDALLAAMQKAAAGTQVTMTFPDQKPVEVANTASGGKISSFSTYGVNYNLDTANPLIAAPGGNILSTWPVKYGSYAIISGTSMAAPFIAGSAAVFLAAKGKNAAQAAFFPTAIATTANPVLDYAQGSTQLATVIQQGAGLLNLSHAFSASSVVTPQMMYLNDTAAFVSSQKFKVKNSGTKAVTYTVTHKAAGTALTLDTNAKSYFKWPVPTVANAASVRFSSSQFTVQAGRTVTITATFTAPTGLNAKQQPLYSGFIYVKSSAETDSYSIPYYGLGARIADQQVLYRDADRFNHTLPVLVDGASKFQDKTQTYTFNGEDYPRISFYLQSGTPYLAIDVVTADAKGLPANPDSKKQRARSLTMEEEAAETMGFQRRSGYGYMPIMQDDLMPRAAAAVQVPSNLLAAAVTQKPFATLGQANGGSLSYAPRSDGDTYTYPWDGAVVDAASGSTTYVPNGSYRLFVSALKISGDAAKASDYETWLSPIIVVNRS